MDHNHSDYSMLQILFVLNSPVHRQKRLEPSLLGRRQQLSVLPARQARLGHRLTLDACQRILQFSGNTLVEQQLHRSSLKTSGFACSRAWTAASRVTGGKSSRNSSNVWPPSR